MSFIHYPSPNYNSRDGQEIDMLVLHYTGMPSKDAALARLCDEAAEVSAHYLVDEDGSIYHLVEEEMRAWHAGVAYWRGEVNLNHRSIGIELVNPGHEHGYRAFPKPQMEALRTLCQGIIHRHPIPAGNVVGHADISPMRKQDPGELFDWQWLARYGVGLWPAMLIEGAQIGDSWTHALAHYGYDISDVNAAVTAFQRHFRVSNVTGEWDVECTRILAGLLRMI